ncbi:MAG: integrase, partial [Flavobacteriaceae bacterium]|nr:integrase [Flavobacteriaceae bacterium]
MKWESKLIKHNGTFRIAIIFEKNAELIARIKTVKGSRWSQSLGVWHIPDTEENRIQLKIEPLSHSIPSTEGIEQIEKFKQWLLSKRYSPSTIKTYSEALKSFLIYYREKPVAEITNEDVIIYNNDYILKNN